VEHRAKGTRHSQRRDTAFMTTLRKVCHNRSQVIASRNMLALIPLIALVLSAKYSEAFIAVKSYRTYTKHAFPLTAHNSLPDDTRRSLWSLPSKFVLATTLTSWILTPSAAMARLDPVNRPDLLPKDSNQNVIQTEKFLTSGQVKRMNDMLTNLERDTGFRLRVLCQSYPNTPGLGRVDALLCSFYFVAHVLYLTVSLFHLLYNDVLVRYSHSRLLGLGEGGLCINSLCFTGTLSNL
jgi:hypothetical protein